MLTLNALKKTQRRSIDSKFARDNQPTHGPLPSKISENSMHEPKYLLKTYNVKLQVVLGKLQCEEEEVLPLYVRRTQKPQQLERREQRTSFYKFDF